MKGPCPSGLLSNVQNKMDAVPGCILSQEMNTKRADSRVKRKDCLLEFDNYNPKLWGGVNYRIKEMCNIPTKKHNW